MTRSILTATLVLAMGVAFGQASHPSSDKPANQKPPDTNEGERLFQVNCGRCHRPPEQLSPKITGSVLRHMRVRAMLSEEDEKQILKYLAP